MLGFWCVIAEDSVIKNWFVSPQCKNYINQYSDIAVQMMMHMQDQAGGGASASLSCDLILEVLGFSSPLQGTRKGSQQGLGLRVKTSAQLAMCMPPV